MKQGKELVDLAIRYIQDFEFVEAGQVIKLDFSQAINLFIAAYNDGIKAGQASRAPVKWPTHDELMDACDENGFNPIDAQNFIEWMQEHWLKNYMEKGE